MRNKPTSSDTKTGLIELVNEVEREVIAEDKTGATREMVARGTCERIRQRILEEGEP